MRVVSTVASTVVSVALNRRLSNLPSSLQRALSNKALLTSKYDARASARGRSLNVEISSSETPISIRNSVRLTPLDKAEIVARVWRGQKTDELGGVKPLASANCG
jgi:hypothetical protein